MGRRIRGDSPESRAITNEVKAYYSRIEKAKRQTLRGQRISPQIREWINELGERICHTDVLTSKLSIREKFAVVFIINHLFHGGNDRARKIKNYVQRTLVVYHRDQLTMEHVESGEHAGTWKISFEIWSTHLPIGLVKQGALERSGKPSVKEVLQTSFANLFRRRR